MLPANNIIPNSNKSTLTEKIRFINSEKNLSKGSKLLAIEIIIASNWRGYCWHSIEAFCNMISAGESQVHLYIKELQNSGHLIVIRRPGMTSRYYLGEKFNHNLQKNRDDGGGSDLHTLKGNINTEKENVPGENVIPFSSLENIPTSSNDVHEPNNSSHKASSPKQIKPTQNTVFNLELVLEIEKITGDRTSRGCWIKIVRSVPSNLIYAGISSLKIAINEGIVGNRGAYFVGIIKNNCDIFSYQKKSPVVDLTKVEPVIVGPRTPKEPPCGPIIPAGPEVVNKSLSKIREILNKPRLDIGTSKLPISRSYQI